MRSFERVAVNAILYNVFKRAFVQAGEVFGCSEDEIETKLADAPQRIWLKAGEDHVDAIAMARLAQFKIENGYRPIEGYSIQPLYLYSADARKSAGQSLLQDRF